MTNIEVKDNEIDNDKCATGNYRNRVVAFVHHQMIERGMYNAQGQQTTPNVRMRELGGGVGGKERAVRTPKTPSGAKRRRSHNYLPRMRLRDFVGEGEMPDGYEDYDEPEEAFAPPRMRLREFEAGRKEEKRRPSKAQEIAITMNNNPRRRQAKAKAYDCPWCDDWHVGHDNKLVPLWKQKKFR